MFSVIICLYLLIGTIYSIHLFSIAPKFPAMGKPPFRTVAVAFFVLVATWPIIGYLHIVASVKGRL